jgi:hypothetical protein
VKDAIVHRLLGRLIRGQMGVVEMRGVAVGKGDQQRAAERLYVGLERHAAIILDLCQRKLYWTARPRKRPPVLGEV